MKKPNLIHHYTTIENLALILKSGKMRFNRLDKVDDLKESQKVSKIEFGKYFFVSCWTDSEDENIPLWEMYSKNMKGVRISLPNYPFQLLPMKPNLKWNIPYFVNGTFLSPLQLDQIFTDKYFIMTSFLNKEKFGGKVKYIRNVNKYYKERIEWKTSPPNKVLLTIKDFMDLPLTKELKWKFQEEFRFVLNINSSVKLSDKGIADPNFYNNISTHVLNCYKNGVSPGIEFIDLNLDQTAIDSILITLGPKCNESEKIIVETLVEKYTKNGAIQESQLLIRK